MNVTGNHQNVISTDSTVILSLDIFIPRRTGILHTTSFSECTAVISLFCILSFSDFLVFVFIFTSRFKYFIG